MLPRLRFCVISADLDQPSAAGMRLRRRRFRLGNVGFGNVGFGNVGFGNVGFGNVSLCDVSLGGGPLRVSLGAGRDLAWLGRCDDDGTRSVAGLNTYPPTATALVIFTLKVTDVLTGSVSPNDSSL